MCSSYCTIHMYIYTINTVGLTDTSVLLLRVPSQVKQASGNKLNCITLYVLNLRTVLFRPLWTHQRSTEE